METTKLFTIWTTILLFASPLLCMSQEVDSTYIVPFEETFSIRVYTAYNYTSINNEYKDDSENTKFRTNAPMGLGLGISLGNSTISGSYGFGFLRDRSKGKTSSINFQYHYYGRKFLFDVYFQRHKGFYETNDDNKVLSIRPDIKHQQYGVLGYYVFNGKTFSYKASFNQIEVQRKSAGSFNIGGGALYNKIHTDEAFITQNSYNQKNLQLMLGGGYAYTWVVSPRFYMTGALSVGVNLSTNDIHDFYKHKINVYPSLFPRTAIGYNGNGWTASLTYLNSRVYLYHKADKDLTLDTGTVLLTFVKRFNTNNKLANKLLDARKKMPVF